MNNKIGNWSMRKTACVGIMFVALFSVRSAMSGENYFLNWHLPNSPESPLDWNDYRNWKVGGDSESDPIATALPVRGTDMVIFRGATVHVKVDQPTEMPVVQLNGSSNRFEGDPSEVHLYITPSGSLHYGFTELVAGSSLYVSGGGTLLVDDGMEFSSNPGSVVSFSDVSMSNLTINAMRHDENVGLHGVTADKLAVNLATYNDSDNADNVLVIDGESKIGDFTLGGHYYDSTVYVTNGPVFRSFTFSRGEATRYNEGTVLSNLFYASGVDLGNVTLPINSLPDYIYWLDGGTRAAFTMWDPATIGGSGDVMRISGQGTIVTNLTVTFAGRDSKLEISDGASVESRRVLLGYGGVSGVSARVSGSGTTWLLQPRNMELESVLSIGQGNGTDQPSAGNVLIVEDGAVVNVSTNFSFNNEKMVERLTGILIGAEPGDDNNMMIVRSGAIVSNDYWTGVGGTFNSSGAEGGKGNVLRVDNATYLGGIRYNDVWDATLFLGGGHGISNRLEVVNGGVARFTGCVQFARGKDGGGSAIFIDDGKVEIASRGDIYPATLEYGRSTIEIGGKTGSFKIAELTLSGHDDAVGQDNGWMASSTGYNLVLHVDRNRKSDDGPMFTTTGAMYDQSKDVFVGKASKDTINVTLDINSKWARSGKDNTITLISAGYGNNDYRYTENGLNAIKAELADTVESAGCTLSVSHDEANRRILLTLTAGAKSGFAIVVR